MQTLTIKTPNGTEVSITAEHETEIIKKAAFWFSIPTLCPICNAPVRFGYRTPQTYEYYELVCAGPVRHSVNLGEKKGTHDLYYDTKKRWGNWNPAQNDDSSAAAAESDAAPTHANAPDEARGKLIQRIRSLHDDCRSRNIDGYQKVDVRQIGGWPVGYLERAAAYLQQLLDNPQGK